LGGLGETLKIPVKFCLDIPTFQLTMLWWNFFVMKGDEERNRKSVGLFRGLDTLDKVYEPGAPGVPERKRKNRRKKRKKEKEKEKERNTNKKASASKG
jgi:hypothetical protein